MLLRRYWSEGLPLIPDLHFDLLGVYVGVSTLVINYRNQKGVLVERGSDLRRGDRHAGPRLLPAGR